MDKLDLYNEALALLGRRPLSALDDDTESRYRLDGAYTRVAVQYCLESARPYFASKTTELNSPTAGTTFEWRHDLPEDHIETIAFFSDSRLDQEINRFVREGSSVSLDYQRLWIRYISDSLVDDETQWTPSFVRLVGAYLATQVAPRLAPNEAEAAAKAWGERLAQVRAESSAYESSSRPSKIETTLTNDWLPIYNDALYIMGLAEITGLDDDSDRRQKLDRTLSAGIVSDILEDNGWSFGRTTVELSFDPSIEPEFGYAYAHEKPEDLHIIHGIFCDEYLRVPLKNYHDEGRYFFSGYQRMYIQYVQKEYLVNPAQWPTYFKRLVAGRMAHDAVGSLATDITATLEPREMLDRAATEYESRRRSARNTDAIQSPPRMIADGNWSKSRTRGRGPYRGRP